jgi:hypothetical protein
VEQVEDDRKQKENLIIHLQVNGHPVIVPFRGTSADGSKETLSHTFRRVNDISRLLFSARYDSPPRSLVMSASDAAEYRVLNPV